MGRAAAATTAAAVVALLVYWVLSRRLPGKAGEKGSGKRRRFVRRPTQAPATWRDVVATLAETVRFTYSETLGKWPIGDLAFGINYLMRQQGNLQVDSVYAGNNCTELKGREVMVELIYLLRFLNLCMWFSKNPFQVFLENAGCSQEDVLLQEPKAGLLKPSFAILRDRNSKCLLLLIRGTHSIKDTLTAATGAVVPFHHLVLREGSVSSLVLGYAHCGMVAAARWIAKCTTSTLLKAVNQYPDYNIKIIGHSLGGGTAALLTYILREHEEFSSSTCVTFAPAACMTWDLAESGKHFITTIINGSDLVPAFSSASIDNLRFEVTASSWLNDLRDRIKRTRFLNVVYRSVTTLVSHLPLISHSRARVAGTDTRLQPVSDSSEVSAEPVLDEPEFISSGSYNGKPAGIEKLRQLDQSSGATLVEEMTEGELWSALEKDLHGNDEDDKAREEEAAAVKEIEEEESMVLKKAAENKLPSPSEKHQFYPPGRIMHMVMLQALDSNLGKDAIGDKDVGIYETPRYLYGKIRLSRTMINDHYMPMYKQMMELLIDKLGKDDNGCETILI
ncbi:uncharacterized protein LOC103719764 [Phoenix dactylifera]|uniref:Uncharacterized protein LOC103719764 n=1 Tax=Phoenix dactylifera TaxID=42345 RepID=A0A8B7CVP4_PHODC|nr:uncharacterized protein LOC103719764 [Phoenix dactylifera]